MNIFLHILQILQFVLFTFCCDCKVNNFQWKACFPEEVNSLKLSISPTISENCGSIIFNGTTGHNLGKITSAQVEAEGSVNGFPTVTYSEPYACAFTKARNGEEDEISFVRNIMPTLCSKIGGGLFGLETPMDEDDQQLFQTISGSFKIRVRARHINNDRHLSDCYDFSGTLDCLSEDYD